MNGAPIAREPLTPAHRAAARSLSSPDTPGRAPRGLSACPRHASPTATRPAPARPRRRRLARDGGRAFVSRALRPYLAAALLDGVDGGLATGAPAVVVAGDDRQARELAADMRAWLAPRPVRFYPSRGVAYESHLAPPPHLVGLRVAALDALLAPRRRRAAGRRRLAPSRCREKVPDPALRPHALHARARATCSISTRSPPSSSRPATSASTRSRTAASSRSAAGILDVYPGDRGPRRARRPVRRSRSSRCAGSRRSPSARSATPSAVEIAPAAELAAEHRELAEIAALGGRRTSGPDVAELLPVDRFHALLDLVPADAAVLIAAEEEVAPALADHWQDVTRGVPRRRRPPPLRRARTRSRPRSTRAPASASRRSSADQPLEFRAQAADVGRALAEGRRAGAREARPLGLPHRRRAGRAAARASAPPTTSARLSARWLEATRQHAAAARRGLAALRRGARCATASSPPGFSSP